MPSPRLFLLATVAAGIFAIAGPAAAEIVGTAGAVNPASTSLAPGANVRVIEIGAKVVHRERIKTSDKGSVQLVFVDKTSISIGPNSDVTIDEFVYDPKAGTGRMAATLTKGVLRFVGGNTSHTGGATITTPAATLGIRGGMNTTSHDPAQGTFTVAHFGSTSVDGATGRDMLIRPDFGMSVGMRGERTQPRRIQPNELAAIASRLTSARGQTGGAPRRPTPETVARAGVGNANSDVPPSAPSMQGQTTASDSSQSEPTPETVEQQTGVEQAVQTGSQSQASEQTASQHKPPDDGYHHPPPDHPPGAQRWWAMAMSIDPNLAAAGAPYLHPDFVAPAGTFYNSPVLGYGQGGPYPGGTFSRYVQAGLNLTGSGPSQVSTIYVASGGTEVSSIHGKNVWSGGFAATTQRNSTHATGVSVGPLGGIGPDIVYDSSYSPLIARVRSYNIGGNDNLQTNTSAFYFAPNSGSGNYSFDQTANRIVNPTGLGATRPEYVLHGWASGLMTTYAKSNGGAIAATFAFDGAAIAFLPAPTINRMSFGISGVNLNASGVTGELSSADLYFGSFGTGTAGNRGAYIDYDNFGGRETRMVSNNGSPSLVNDQPVASASGLYASSKLVNAQGLTAPGKALAGVTLCTCEYTRWGFWSSATARAGTVDTYEDRLHLGTWVVGLPTQVVDVPTSGVATFTGHVIASIKNGSNQYVAGGNLSNTVNFATRTGAVSVTNLDGHNYSGTVSYPSHGNVFSSGGTGLAGAGFANPTMHMKGQFYDHPTKGRAWEMGGTVSIQSSTATYRGAGTFAATR